MVNSAKIERYMRAKVLPCIWKKFPDAAMTTEYHVMGTNLMRFSFSNVIRGFFTEGDNLEVPFMSGGHQPFIEELAKVLTRKTGLNVTAGPSCVLIPCD